MIHNPLYNVYVASCDADGGIYRYHMYPDGSLKKTGFTPMDRPMYMAMDRDKMYILLRAPFKDTKDSGLVVYDIDADGDLKNPSEIISTKGEVACHLSVCNDDVYCANYISGSVIKMPCKLVVHSGKGIHPTRQEAPHAHYAGFTPDKKYVCAADLGTDGIYLYDRDLNFTDRVRVPDGHGARHIVFSDDGKYCFVANELKSSVSLFRYECGNLKYIETLNYMESLYDGETTASAIRFKDNYIYVSNRGHDTISVLQFQDEKLKYLDSYDCRGSFPRDFDILSGYLVCTNEKSDNVTVLDGHKVIHTETDIKSPICIVYGKI